MAARSVLRSGEGPTWLALIACYAAWGGATAALGAFGGATGWGLAGLVWLIPAALCVGLHASLQHEALHGHPTRSAALNEALVFPALGLLYPYRRFRELHLRHHHDERLTDPYDDPESWYLARADADRLGAPLRLLLEANRTLAGRMALGPWLGFRGLLRADLPGIAAGDRRLIGAWARHVGGVALALSWVWGACGVPPLLYLCGAALPGAALIYMRSYIEHRAAEAPAHRSAVVEAGRFWSLLFLNNNLHAVHHADPAAPWHALPARWRATRAAVLARNGGYLTPGYGAVFARWFWRKREPLAHPLLRREGP